MKFFLPCINKPLHNLLFTMLFKLLFVNTHDCSWVEPIASCQFTCFSNPGLETLDPQSCMIYMPGSVWWLLHYGATMKLKTYDDVIKWKHFPRYWPFVQGIHRSPVNSPHKGQWRGALVFSLIAAWIDGWVNNREAGDLRRYRAYYEVTVMCLSGQIIFMCCVELDSPCKILKQKARTLCLCKRRVPECFANNKSLF